MTADSLNSQGQSQIRVQATRDGLFSISKLENFILLREG